MTVTDWQDDLAEGGAIAEGVVVEVLDAGWVVIAYKDQHGQQRRARFHQESGQIVQADAD